jgi:hypothetical protein
MVCALKSCADVDPANQNGATHGRRQRVSGSDLNERRSFWHVTYLPALTLIALMAVVCPVLIMTRG